MILKEYQLSSFNSFHTKTALSSIVLATTTIRLDSRCSKLGTFSAFKRISPKVTEVNGILILSFTWALLNSTLLRRSIITTSSGFFFSNLTKSLALIRAHRSFCKSFRSTPLISYIENMQNLKGYFITIMQ